MKVKKIEAQMVLDDDRKITYTFTPHEDSTMEFEMESTYDDPEQVEIFPNAWLMPPSIMIDSTVKISDIGKWEWRRE